MNELCVFCKKALLDEALPGMTLVATGHADDCPLKNKEIIEKLAEIEHNQWVEWSQELFKSEKRLSFARIERWKLLWKPYSELTEEQKEQDRIYARKVLSAIQTNGSQDNLKGE